MKKQIFHQANSRGEADHGWLKSFHTFSFANYYHPERMHFGVLRVLNDDTVSGGMGFGTHPHENMEIISIPLEGDLEHRDSMQNTTIIRKGDIQVMSAGTGVYHSEFNKNKAETVKFLQIWIFPNKKNVPPRYDQMSLNPKDRKNKLQQVLSPYPDDDGVWIHQDAWFHLGHFDKGQPVHYQLKKEGNGVYAFIIKGSFVVDRQTMGPRDGLGITGTNDIEIIILEDDAEILLMEVPMG
jgi:redox-sensitive bicupin YhaK (pirin superfamily)